MLVEEVPERFHLGQFRHGSSLPQYAPGRIGRAFAPSRRPARRARRIAAASHQPGRPLRGRSGALRRRTGPRRTQPDPHRTAPGPASNRTAPHRAPLPPEQTLPDAALGVL
ncbi:hypothetical protein SSP531S_38660 [Streptomyces spongiicola]|uniref:Uncharacterized protein n=1 Tax=Streptomyces spongiicola TaxID=1690221 RepID=A0A388T0H2_9ACTN|nr:hypothetical protein SSP531S_38660 [Streptomyces spongiicola]